MQPLPEISETGPKSTFEAIVAELPEKIATADHERVISHINHPRSPIFTTPATPGVRLADVLAPEAQSDIFQLISQAERAGGALGKHRSERDVYRVIARPLATSGLTLLIFRSDDASEQPTILVISSLTTD